MEDLTSVRLPVPLIVEARRLGEPDGLAGSEMVRRALRIGLDALARQQADRQRVSAELNAMANR